METRVGHWLERLVEAGWLVALIVVPIFFNFYASEPFGLSKVLFVRSLAVTLVLVLILWFLEGPAWRERLRPQRLVAGLRQPLILPVLLIALVYVAATAASVLPAVSWWGSYERQQGAYTVLSYLAFFFLVYGFLRREDQFNRAIDVIIIVGWVVVLYSLLQYFSLDPVNWTAADRLVGTLGNPNFMSAYLILVIPLTLARLVQASGLMEGAYVKAGLYGVLLLAQLLVLILTQSRGPFLGMLAALFAFLLLLIAVRRKGRLLGVTIGLAVAAVAFIVALNLPNTPLAPLKSSIGLLNRMGRIVSDQPDRTVTARILTWGATSDIVSENPRRLLIGTGPDTYGLMYYQHASPELAAERGPFRNPDRAHNEVWDTWAKSGLLGVVALFLLYGAVFYHALSWLNLIAGRREQLAFWAFAGFGGLGGALLGTVFGEIAFLGVGLSFGFLAGVLGYLLVRAFAWRSEPALSEVTPRHLFIMALLAAIVAHLVDVQLSFTVVTTGFLFWVYLALLVVVGRGFEEMPRPANVASGRTRRPNRNAEPEPDQPPSSLFDWPVLCGGLVGLILFTLTLEMITLDFERSQDSLPMVVLVVGTWLVPALFVLLAAWRSETEARVGWISALLGYAASSGVGFGVLWLIHLGLTRGAGVRGETYRSVLFFGYLFLSLLAIALIVSRRQSLPDRWGTRRALLYPILVVAALWGLWNTTLSLGEADFYFRLGREVQQRDQPELALNLYQQAVDTVPSRHIYYRALGSAARDIIAVTEDVDQALDLFERGRQALRRAEELNPLDPDNYIGMGRFFLVWGSRGVQLPERAVRFEAATKFYEQAFQLSPVVHPQLYREEALSAYLQLGRTAEFLNNFPRSIEAYKQALALDPESYQAHRGLTQAYQRAGQFDKALEQAEIALPLAPTENERTAVENLIQRLKDIQTQ